MTNKTEYTQDEIASKLKQSIKKLLKEDKFLLENLANERSVSYKLAEYLQKSFGKKFNVDCEYNLNKLETKTLDGIKECSKQRRTNRIYPDIIVHKRNTNENILVIELKTRMIENNCDIIKLKQFTSKENIYKYQFGVFIQFNKLNKPLIKWFQNGEEKAKIQTN